MQAQLMGEANLVATVWPRERSGVAACMGRLLILACVLLGVAGDALAVYSPRTGRFLQKDPNESGMLHAELWHGGEAPMPELMAGSLRGATTDGSNLFAFVRNSPFNGTDPGGLFLGLAAQALSFGVSQFLGATGSLYEAQQGIVTVLETDAQLSGYAEMQEMYVEWALDWSMPDDLFNESIGTSADYQHDSPAMGVSRGIDDLFKGMGTGAAKGSRSTGRLLTSMGAVRQALLKRVLSDPARFLRGKAPGEVQHIIRAGQSAGWKVGKLGDGSMAGHGFRMFDGRGNSIRWHPPESRHHPEFAGRSYWTVSSGQSKIRVQGW